ncbi:hypothetical protein CEUSTIGMA_g9490.t1 [Chlamydomonas eustigma]|uniref:Complex III subunit VII n=1 Tax=Chlamydomonas eustigma TaxID=1157962 RepID=A0A250XGL5_9CHLO|nr:hypothetical protein CEUSTIGMA_g9490.t1 [Chlamydomonas eustigma]|eukprot:GAX82062.1 hypothetical protein CEUSTIGMA_g9490.t1 [Chlamydomonas eustigma]
MDVVTSSESESTRTGDTDAVFLYHLVPGHETPSFGIHCAKVSGIPGQVLDRAKEVLHSQETGAPLRVPSTLGVKVHDKVSSMALLKSMFRPLWDAMARPYRAAVYKELSQYGLRYDDLYDPLKDEDVAEALRRLPPEVILERNCRLRRAADLDMKHDHLHGELLAKQTPGEHYLQEALEEVRKERRERALLGTQPAYTRIYY